MKRTTRFIVKWKTRYPLDERLRRLLYRARKYSAKAQRIMGADESLYEDQIQTLLDSIGRCKDNGYKLRCMRTLVYSVVRYSRQSIYHARLMRNVPQFHTKSKESKEEETRRFIEKIKSGPKLESVNNVWTHKDPDTGDTLTYFTGRLHSDAEHAKHCSCGNILEHTDEWYSLHAEPEEVKRLEEYLNKKGLPGQASLCREYLDKHHP